MLKRIISGGQTGADRAALDVAIKLNIEHGGWIPKGRKTEDGALPEKYKLLEMKSKDYRERTRQNIIDSQGTLIISRGPLTGGSRLTQSYAKVINRPNCHIDLANTQEFEASIIVQSFILENRIEVLNVAGPRLSNEPWIYKDVKNFLELILYLLFLDTKKDMFIKQFIPAEPIKEDFPKSMEEAVSLLCNDMPLKTKAFIAKFKSKNIYMLYFTMLDYIRHRLGFDTGNIFLLKDCALKMNAQITIEDAVMKILKRFKNHLEKDHILKVVK